MQCLKHFWRVVGKLGALAFIFVGGCPLALIILPVMALLPGQQQEHAQRAIHKLFRFYLRAIQLWGLISLKVDDADKFAKCSGKIVIANHPSLLDVVILMALIPRTQCIVKHELWNHPFLGGLMRRAGYIRNDLEPEKLVAACKASLDEGRCLIIFPEGTRTVPGGLPNFLRGFANVATLTKAPIQTVFIDCSPPFLFKGEPWWHFPSQKPHFQVAMGQCLDVPMYSLYDQRSINARKLVKSLEIYYAERARNRQP